MDEVKSLKSPPKLKYSLQPLAAFLITFFGYIFLCLICDVYPFGNFVLSLSDMTAQYVPFLAMYNNKLSSLGADHLISNLTYSFQAGLGKNFMATFGYYLGSPANLIYAAEGVSAVEQFVVIALIFKMSFASAFMCMFLRTRAEDKKSRWPVLLGVAYAFSSYMVAYGFQIMWHDGYMLLPLLLYFIEKFIAKGKYKGIVITLLWLFVANYYIAYMVGIFSFLYLATRLYSLQKPWKESLKICGKYVLLAIADALILCVILIPVGLDTIRNADKTLYSQSSDYVRYTFLDLINQMFLGESGEFADVMPYNLPWLFLSLMVTCLLVVYFVSKAYAGKTRRVHLIALIFVYLSTAVYFLDIAWQVFDEPNWFSHRHVFVFYPIFLVITLRALEKIREVTKKEFLISFGIVAAALFVAGSIGEMKSYDGRFLWNLVLIAVYFTIFVLMGKTNWSDLAPNMPQLLPFILALIVGFEVIYAEPLLSADLATFTVYEGEASEYIDSIYAMQELGEVSDLTYEVTGAVRADSEKTTLYSTKYLTGEGESMFGDYSGVSFFNSSSNKTFFRFLKQLGYTVNYNYFAVSYSYSAPATDAFLSVGAVATLREYTLAGLAGNDSFDCGYNFYVNQNALSLGFAVDSSARDFDFYQLETATSDKNYFAFQNDWYKSLFPDNFTEDFYICLDDSAIVLDEIKNATSYDETDYTSHAALEAKENAETDSDADTTSDTDPLGNEDKAFEKATENTDVYYRQNENIPIVVDYSFDVPEEGEYYLNISVPTTLSTMSVYCNGILLSSATDGTFYSQIYRLGDFDGGETVKVSLLSDSDSLKVMDVNVSRFDYASFKEQFSSIDTSEVTLVSMEDGYVEFETNVKAGHTVLTTIPYEDGWTLKIDGQEAEITPYQDALVAFDVPSGTHTVALEFRAPGFNIGCAASVCGVVLLCGIAIFDKSAKKPKKKAQRA